jgi:hypothetical protein
VEINEKDQAVRERFFGVGKDDVAAGVPGILAFAKPTSPYPDHTPDDFSDDRSPGAKMIEVDPDDSAPSMTDQSFRAHLKRCQNCLEQAQDADDDAAMGHVAAAREHLDRAIAKRGMGAGVHFRR